MVLVDKWQDGRAQFDDFWDLESLLPKHRPREVRSTTFSPTPQLREIGDATPERASDERRITPPLDEESVVSEYKPGENCLIDTVRIHARREAYPFYGQFRRDAERYLSVEGTECPFVHFFSYIPQYSQLSAEQRDYYFFWRSRVRAREYHRTEESYFYLYVYEIINLPDKIPPAEGARLLARVWAAYRDAFPRVDKYMAEWLADYCLVHALPCPQEEIRHFRAKILPHASCREFYLGEMGEMTEAGIDTALAFFSDYRFRDSRYAQGENAPLFEKHILAAVVPVLRSFFARQGKPFSSTATTRRVRDAFCGSLCAHHVRSRIEILYYAVADVAPLRALLTNAVKYAENKLRARLAVKSRLSVQSLAPEYREMIDRYFDSLTSGARREAPRAAYEALYDAPSQEVSFAAAAAIEESSWQTTKLLTEEEENGASPVLESEELAEKTQYFAADCAFEQNGPFDEKNAFTSLEREYLSLLLRGEREKARRVATDARQMEDELVDGINGKSMELLSDIALEMTEDGYAVISDYYDEVLEWTK